MNIRRLWNGRTLGLPLGAMVFFVVASKRVLDRIATALWRGNLGALGSRSIIQVGVSFRYPGRVQIGERCSVASGCSFTSEHSDGSLELGTATIVNRDVTVDFTGGVVVERGVVISEGVTIYSHTHGHDPRSASKKTPLIIGEGTWIGARAMICEGVGYIAPETIVAAGAVVTREIREPGVYGGVPARFIKKLDA